ncbi:MAG: hypothetical protein JSV00_02845, partial [bacterium]
EFAAAGPRGRLSVHLYPGYWVSRPLPEEEMSPGQLERWARSVALGEGVNVILATPDGGIVRISGTGRITGRSRG